MRSGDGFTKTRRISKHCPTFVVADLNVRGELQFKAEYDYPSLDQIPFAGELIIQLATALYRTPEEFEIQLRPKLWFRWRAFAESAGMATMRCNDELASLSLLVAGVDRDADAITFSAFQSHLLKQLHDSGTEPAFDLLNLTERPLIATINFLSPPDETDRLTVALADRCFAAAYFRYQKLA